MHETRHRAGRRGVQMAVYAVLLAALGTAACHDAADPAAPRPLLARQPAMAAGAPDRGGVGAPIPDEYIVTFKEDAGDVSGLARQLVAQHGGTMRFTYSAALKGFAGKLPAQAVRALQNNPQVDRIEQDRIAQAADVQTGATWGIDRLDQRALPVDKLYTYVHAGAGVNVYIIDSGIRTSHVEFGGRAVGAYTAIGDGNGSADCSGHGTHVAGTIGSRAYGVAKGVKLYSVRVLGCDGSGSVSGIIAGIDWVTKNRVLPAVANLSLGASASSTLDEAVQNSINAGVVYAISAGNKSTDACTQSPARAAAALTVAAVQSDDAQAAFSNFGSCVDIYAPGRYITSTSNASDSSSELRSGTSMASPHVAGVAALYLGANPGATPAQVAQALTSNATSGIVTAIGAGSPNLLLNVIFLAGSTTPPPSDTVIVTQPAPTPASTPLVPSFTVSCLKSVCTFDAGGSSGGMAPSQFTWHFGDASASATSIGAKITHQYAAKGKYTVVLTVTDAAGQRASSTQAVTVRKL